MPKRRRLALSREEVASEGASPKPLAERPAAEILRAVLELFWLLRLWHHRARGETFLVCDRGAITKTGIVPVYLDHELPLREAGELVADLLRPYPPGHAWRWRLVLCPVRERTRTGIHLLLMDPPRKDRPWSEPMWLRSSTYSAHVREARRAFRLAALAAHQSKLATARAGAAHEPEKDRRPAHGAASSPCRNRPKKRKAAQAGPSPRATMGAE